MLAEPNIAPVLPSTASKRTALVFIHGIGVQDRFQQLTSFVQGLTQTKVPQFTVRDRLGDAVPQSAFIPLTITAQNEDGHSETVEIDVYEIYWAPLLNGLTTFLSVIQWVALTIWRTMPWNRALLIEESDSTRTAASRSSSNVKWAFDSLYSAMGLLLTLFVPAMLLWLTLGSFLLGIDQLSYQNQKIINSPYFYQSQSAAKDKNLFVYRMKDLRDAKGESVRWFSPAFDFWRQAVPYLSERGIEKNERQGLSLQVDQFVRTFTPRDLIVGFGFTLVFGWAFYWTLKYIFDAVSLIVRAFWHYTNRLYIELLPDALTSMLHQKEDHTLEVKLPGDVLFWFRFVKATLSNLSELRDFIVESLSLRVFAVAGMVLIVLFLINYTNVILTFMLVPLVLFWFTYTRLRYAYINILGDVEIYATYNEHNPKYRGRQEVLNRAMATIAPILNSPDYDRVYFAGHSLGSVIGLEMLRKLFTDYIQNYPSDVRLLSASQRNYEKIKAFITFGSPLEKMRLFFEVNSYKRRFGEFNEKADTFLFEETNPQGVPGNHHRIGWHNFWIWTDVVCNPLNSYAVPKEQNIQLPGHIKLWSHSDYWYDPHFVARLLQILCPLKPNRDKSAGDQAIS